MIYKISTIGLLVFIAASQLAYGQDNKAIALEKGRNAIKLMDSGKIDESIKLLEEAQKLDSEKFDYPYELAYAYYSKEEYPKAIKILEGNSNHKDVTERLYQLLGNSYDITGKSDKAFAVYNAGLKKFPNSGILYLEEGNVHWNKKEYGEALPFYEKGIEADPAFSSNYYRATRIYCASTEEVWGMIYGEIFMNLERSSDRTAEISKLLFDTYKSEIKFSSDTSFSVSFSQNAAIHAGAAKGAGNLKIPYGIGIYEPTLMISLLSAKSININSLDNIRTRFVNHYFGNGQHKSYPNALFSYQRKIKEAGHLEAYNHWILMKGDEAGFNQWRATSQDKWSSFVKWFGDNGMTVNNSNRFYRKQYE